MSPPTLHGPRAFLSVSLTRALELGLGTPDDVLVHATPDVLSAHLPRAVWTQLLAACLAAPRTDARLVVDTVTIPVLCEHVPEPILWACLAQLATRALGRGLVAPPPPTSTASSSVVTSAIAPTPSAPIAAAPIAPIAAAPSASMSAVPIAPFAVAPSAPIATTPLAPLTSARASTADERTAEVTRIVAASSVTAAAPLPATPTRASTENGRKSAEPPPLGDPPAPPRTASGSAPRTTLGNRRPQAAAAMAPRRSDPRPPPGRASTATDFEIETDLGEAWKKDAEAVDDDQLIDWAQSEETQTGDKR